MGRGLTVTGAEAKALFDGATATMQGANLIENEYAPLVPQYANFFFFITGFHGFHVFVGTCFLIVCWFRARAGHFTPEHHFGFEAAAWYWHFVDVVWLFLFICIYWWGG